MSPEFRGTRHKTPEYIVDRELIELHELGIKETGEAVDAIDGLVVCAVNIAVRGWRIWEIPKHLWRALMAYRKMKKAIKGCKQIPAEVKDLDKQEKAELMGKGSQIIVHVVQILGFEVDKK